MRFACMEELEAESRNVWLGVGRSVNRSTDRQGQRSRFGEGGREAGTEPSSCCRPLQVSYGGACQARSGDGDSDSEDRGK